MIRRIPALGLTCAAIVIAILAFFAGARSVDGAPPTPRVARSFAWHLPPGFPQPKVPADNPMSDEKVDLGRHLFYDKRLSGNGTFSCASCHQQARGFADTLARAVGSTGQMHPRNSMGLTNVAYSPVLTWANSLQRALETQALGPMFGEKPVELGLAGKEKELIARLDADPRYRQMFAQAFPGDTGGTSLLEVTRAIAAFERTLISGDSPFDRASRGDSAAMTAGARRGQQLFFSERLECIHCHGGLNFTGTTDYVGKGFAEIEFHNTGLYNVDGKGSYPVGNQGLKDVTGRAADMGRFKAPSLRNVAVTAPYMHDGSIRTLDGVIAHYMAGGRTISEGAAKGVGSTNPYKSGFVKGFTLSQRERRDLVAFLLSLTDSTFLTDPRFANPWPDTSVAVRGPTKAGSGR
jgi:cytochrome c peroxidase